MIRQCPLCPLRFDLAPLLADHLATDHGVDPEQTDHLQPPSRRVKGESAVPNDEGKAS